MIVMDYEFTSVLDLKARVKPALDTKVKEMQIKNIKYVSQDDIFEYLRNNVWPLKNNLALYMIVDDILNTDNEVFCNYVLNKRKNHDKL